MSLVDQREAWIVPTLPAIPANTGPTKARPGNFAMALSNASPANVDMAMARNKDPQPLDR